MNNYLVLAIQKYLITVLSFNAKPLTLKEHGAIFSFLARYHNRIQHNHAGTTFVMYVFVRPLKFHHYRKQQKENKMVNG